MIEYFDSHCHLTDSAFRDDREAVLFRAAEAGVTRLVTVASSLADARSALALAEGRRGVWCTVGIHPHEARNARAEDLDGVRELARRRDPVVAIGETGLDFRYERSPRAVQQELFRAHLEIGAETGLPVVVHSREADVEVAAALRAMPAGTRGVLHCFTGGPESFEVAMASGWYVSFSGIASFERFAALDALGAVPPDRLLVETDAPYLAPVPLRGRRNEPAFVVRVVEALARRLGTDARELARRTTENACRFYEVS